jgi:two-component system, OmpR family, sensor histidine kinase CiaH
MPDARKRLLRTTAIYWMLLFYVIAALVWWFISLNNQNDTMRKLELSNIRYHRDSIAAPVDFKKEISSAEHEYRVNRSKYLGEGIIFFLLIILSAAYVYRAVRRQFKLQQQQQNFMMAVTHELKTPISVTRLNLETLQKYHLDPEKQKKILRATLTETERLNFLTNNILVSSQLEASGYKSSREELDLSDLFSDCLQQLRSRFPERIISENIEKNADVKGDPLLLQILINNLLENAIKYSPRDSVVTASLEKKDPKIILTVSDEGPGIPDDEKKKIFAKFYRIGNESTRKKQGTGLGLYLCRKIARGHNADILVTNNEVGGSNFTVVFHS